MKTRIATIVSLIAVAMTARAADSVWTNGAGKWEDNGNWSNGAPSSSSSKVIVQGSNAVATIDATTSGSFPGTLNISNLFIGGAGAVTAGNPGNGGEVDLVGAGLSTQLDVKVDIEVKPGSALIVTNSAVTVGTLFTAAPALAIDGTLRLDSGKILATNSGNTAMDIGGSDSYHDAFPPYIATHGDATVNDGTLICGDIYVGGETVRASVGTLTVNGGFVQRRILHVGAQNNTGTVWVTGGQLTGTLGMSVGEGGWGLMTVSNGVVSSHGVTVGNFGPGILRLVNGTMYSGDLTVGVGSAGTGDVWMTGGTLVSTDGNTTATLAVGSGNGAGRMTVSNGLVSADFVTVGGSRGGSLTLAGGTLSMDRDMSVGNSVAATSTVWVTGGTLTATNAPISVGATGPGRLVLSNGTVQTLAFRIGTDFIGTTLGVVDLLGGTLIVGGVTNGLLVAPLANSTGTVNIAGGTLTVTNGSLSVGNNGTIISGGGVGKITVSNGTLVTSSILLGSSAGGQGDLTLADGGNISCPGTNCVIAINSLGFDQIGGTLIWAGNTCEIGVTAPGDYNLSGGSAVFDDLYSGYGNVGTMTMAGGVANVNSRLIIGHLGSPVATGTVWMTGGTLTVLNNYTIIGNSGVGRLTMSNGTMTVTSVFVGNSSNPGSLTVAGGTMTALTGVIVGDCDSAITGSVTVTGGDLFVTNVAQNSTLDVRSGTLTISGGFVKADNIVLTNACGRLLRTGGTLQYSQVQLDPSLSAVGDGIPNSWKLQYGLDPFDPNLANEDPDGDGVSNLREYQLGTDPTVSSSPFRITAIAREGSNIRVTWVTIGGVTNIVQVTPGMVNGSYTNNFSDLSPQLIISGVSVTTTNYLDLNGALNSPARYYRIRVVP